MKGKPPEYAHRVNVQSMSTRGRGTVLGRRAGFRVGEFIIEKANR